MNILLVVIGFFLLIKGSDYFVDSASNLAKSLGISSLIIGLTVVAFGTSAPETAVSIISSIEGQNDISIGNVVGSNICNLLLVLGMSGIFCNLNIRKKILYRDYLYSIFSYFLLFITCIINFKSNQTYLTKINGITFLIFLLIYLFILFIDLKDNERQEKTKIKIKIIDFIYMILGILGIVVGGKTVIYGVSNIAIYFGVSDRVIGLTIVALGTSLPELVTSIIASKKGEDNIAIGNVIGSNIFNIFLILGLCSIIKPLKISFMSYVDICILLIISLIILFIIIIRKRKIKLTESIFLIFLYACYLYYILNR